MTRLDALFAAVCAATDLDGNCADTGAVAALADAILEADGPEPVTLVMTDPVLGYFLSVELSPGVVWANLKHDYSVEPHLIAGPDSRAAFTEQFPGWLATAVGFASYLRTK